MQAHGGAADRAVGSGIMNPRKQDAQVEDDFFELHLRRMLDAPSFTGADVPRGISLEGWCSPSGVASSPERASRSEASTRSSDGHDRTANSSGYSSGSGASPHVLRSPAVGTRPGSDIASPHSGNPVKLEARSNRIPPPPPPPAELHAQAWTTPERPKAPLGSEDRLVHSDARRTPMKVPQLPSEVHWQHGSEQLLLSPGRPPSPGRPHMQFKEQEQWQPHQRRQYYEPLQPRGKPVQSQQALPQQQQQCQEKDWQLQQQQQHQLHWAGLKAMREKSVDNDELLNAATLCGLLSSSPQATSSSSQNMQGSSAPSAAQPATPSQSAFPTQRSKSFASRMAGKNRCIQCGVQALDSSAFDHTCPKCSAVVCSDCVDDFRLIITSYRCPQCGDEEANQALLMQNAWLHKAVRSAKTVYRNVSESWKDLFAADDSHAAAHLGTEQSAAPMFCGKDMAAAPPGSDIRTGGPRVPCQPPALRRPAEKARQSQPQPQPRAQTPADVPAASPTPPAPIQSPAASAPEHRTRLPAGWAEGAGAYGAAILQRMGAEDPFQTRVPAQ